MLHLHGYKCFANQTINFAPLTMLVGANASGKSSVIQSLLLLRQSHQRRVLNKSEILLAGALSSVGRVVDIFSQEPLDYEISFMITDDTGAQPFAYTFMDSQA